MRSAEVASEAQQSALEQETRKNLLGQGGEGSPARTFCDCFFIINPNGWFRVGRRRWRPVQAVNWRQQTARIAKQD